MWKTIKCLSAIAIILVSGVVGATQYTAEGPITGMFSGAGNTVGVFHGAVRYNPAGCPNGTTDNAYLIDYTSTADWTKVHAMLLSAYVADEPIRIGVHQTACYSGYPVIQRVAFVKGY